MSLPKPKPQKPIVRSADYWLDRYFEIDVDDKDRQHLRRSYLDLAKESPRVVVGDEGEDEEQ